MQARVKWIAVFVAWLLVAGTPGHTQQAAPRRLTLRDAINLALKQNLSVRVASTRTKSARR